MPNTWPLLCGELALVFVDTGVPCTVLRILWHALIMAETASHFIFMAAYLKRLEMITVVLLRFCIFICNRTCKVNLTYMVLCQGVANFSSD
jgi:hypothetical protein